jgi:hypothetical protein
MGVGVIALVGLRAREDCQRRRALKTSSSLPKVVETY